MNGKRAALLANHGVAAWGVTLDEAMMVAGIVEKPLSFIALRRALAEQCCCLRAILTPCMVFMKPITANVS